MLMMVPGMKNGEMRRGPLLVELVVHASSISGRPPMPEPMLTPMRSAFSGVDLRGRRRAIACSAAAMP